MRIAGRNQLTGSATIVAFIDDDSMVQPGWREFIAAPYADADVASVVGKVILPGFEHLREKGGATAHDKDTWINIQHFGASKPCRVFNGQGCNMSFRLSILERIGGFDEHFLVKADGEESDVFMRLHTEGMPVWYAPDAAVVHECAAPVGYERSAFNRTAVYYSNRNYAYLLTKHYFLKHRWFAFVLSDFFRYAWRCIVRLAVMFGHTLLLIAVNAAGKVVGIREGLRARKRGRRA